jgi:molybdenum cofactor cytidylyltransferase
LIAAIILAAGKSERMGTPKALLRFRGKSFLEHVLHAVKQSSVTHVVVVVGRHWKEIQEAMGPPSPLLVFNPNYEQGMSTSIQAGIRALPPEASAAVLLLVDHPLIKPQTIDKLIGSLRPGSIIVPVYGGRRGHPVLFSKDALEEVLELGPDQGANAVLRRDPGRVVEVPVDDAGTLRDIDTPEDFEALLRESSLI